MEHKKVSRFGKFAFGVAAASIAAEEVNGRNYAAHAAFNTPWDLHPVCTSTIPL